MHRAGKVACFAVVFALGLAAPLTGCAGSSTESSAARKSEPEAEGEPVDEKGKKWGGWRWKGKRADCFYVVDNECFASLKAACTAAGCGASSCEEDERSAPSKVSCGD